MLLKIRFRKEDKIEKEQVIKNTNFENICIR